MFLKLFLFYILLFMTQNKFHKKKNITNSKTLLNFINISGIDSEEDVISNFVKIINGRWKGHVGTITSKYDNKKYVEGKKNIITNLNSTLMLFKKMKKNFKKEEIITQKNEEFLNNIDKNIDNIRKIILKNIDELKNKKIYITLDRYGIKDTKYLPHIKPISVFTKNVKSKIIYIN